MRILFLTQYFWPENFRINEIVEFFNLKKVKLDVLTGRPTYPNKEIFKKYYKKNNFFNFKGLYVNRFYTIPRFNNNISIIANFLSFLIFSPIFFMKFILKKKYDFIFFFGPSPILSFIPVILLNKFFKKKIILWVLDLWPNTLVDLNIIKNKVILKFLNYLVKLIYNNSNLILCQSKSFVKEIKKKTHSKVLYFPAWPENSVFKNSKKNKYIESIKKNKNFKILFAGNFGEAQSLLNVIKSAELLRGTNISWYLLGDGRTKKMINKALLDKNLSNFFLIKPVKPNEVYKYFNSVDALFLSLSNKPTFRNTIPGKLQTYLNSNKPICAMISGEGNRILKKSKAGYVCEADDYKSFAKIILKMSKTSKKKRLKFAHNGKKYANKFFNRENILNDLINKLVNYK